MDNSNKDPQDNETVLMALDQISQTVDVMNSVVNRLRTYLVHREHRPDATPDLERDMAADRVLH